MRLPPRLGRELALWQSDGLITEDQRRAILSRYASPLTTVQLASRTFVWLAILSAGVGVVMPLARNWAAIPSIVKVATAVTMTVAAYAAAAILGRRGKGAETEYAALLAALLAGGALYAGVEATGADPIKTPITLWWSGVLAVTAVVVPSAITAGVGTAVAVWWLLIMGGTGEIPWGFLLVWPLLALAVQRDRKWYAAGGVALAFGCWAFFGAIAAWPDKGANTPAFVVALLTGAWLDALAHAPDGQRPAFARASPALGFTVFAMTMLLPTSSHRLVPDAGVETSNAWMMLAFVATVSASTIYLSTARPAWRWRPLVIVALGLAWLGTWLVAPAAHEAGPVARWAWTLAFSATAVMVGSSAIREYSVSRDEGVFVVGILAVLLTIAVRAADSAQGGIAAQAGILLAAAGLLFWLARVARRAAATPV